MQKQERQNEEAAKPQSSRDIISHMHVMDEDKVDAYATTGRDTRPLSTLAEPLPPTNGLTPGLAVAARSSFSETGVPETEKDHHQKYKGD